MNPFDLIVGELKRESTATRGLIAAIPTDKLEWRPHEKSFTIGQLGYHIAGLPKFMAEASVPDSFEIPGVAMPQPASTAELLELHDSCLEAAVGIIGGMSPDKAMGDWTVWKGGKELMTIPRIGMLRGFMLNHQYHHRGQLSVYLRLLDVPVPSVYGPTADINPFA